MVCYLSLDHSSNGEALTTWPDCRHERACADSLAVRMGVIDTMLGVSRLMLI